MVAGSASLRRRISMYSRLLTSVSCFAVLLAVFTTLLWSQATSTSTVTGQVTDQSGAAVPGAKVTLTDPAISNQLITTTNNDGRYVFSNVNVGSYNITFEKPGFATSKIEKQAVEIGTTLTVNTSMQVGATTTTVEVAAQAAAELQTTNAAVGTTMTNKQI